MAFATRDLSLAYSYAGEYQRAMELADQSVKHTRDSDPTWNKNQVLMVAHKVRADMFARQLDHLKAVDAYKTALNYSSGDWAFFVRVSLANAYVGSKNFVAANALFSEIGMPYSNARKSLVLRGLGNLALANRQSNEALRYFREALQLPLSDDDSYNRVWAFEGAARAHLLAGNKEAAPTKLPRRNAERRAGKSWISQRRIQDGPIWRNAYRI